MTDRFFVCLSVLTIAVTWPINAFCIGGSSIRIDVLCNTSDLVVVGKVGSFVKVGQVPISNGENTLVANLMESAVEIADILKGDEPANSIRIQVPVLQPPGGTVLLDGIESNGVKLLFLRKVGDHLYRVTDPHHPSLPAISASAGSGTLLERVATVECHVIANGASALNDRLDAMWSVRRVDATCIVPTLRDLASQRAPILSLTSEAELMRRGDSLSLGQAIADSQSEQGSDPAYLKGNILGSIEAGKFDESAVPLLSQLAKSNQVRARLAAARALKNIGIQSCTPSLQSLLSDSDQGVRYVAAIALADINNMPDMHPSIQEFQEHEEKYIDYWKKR